MMNKIDCEDLNRWQTVKRGRYGAAPIKILQGKKIHHKQKVALPRCPYHHLLMEVRGKRKIYLAHAGQSADLLTSFDVLTMKICSCFYHME